MVQSPIPFTASFMQKVKEEILKQNMAEVAAQEKQLAKQLEEDYRAWSEEKLKGCPQFMRKFTSKIILSWQDEWGRNIKSFYFQTQQKVCMVPGYTDSEYSDIPTKVQLNDSHPLYSSFIQLKRLRDKLNVQVYTKTRSDNPNSRKKDKCSKSFTLYSTEGDDSLIENMVLEYIEKTKKELNDFISGVQEPAKPEPAKPEKETEEGTWVQLELF